MDPQIVTATSERLKAAGVDHIVLADGRILVEGSRESSRLANIKWRKSALYQKYLRLKAKHGPKGTGKLGIKGGFGLKKTPDGKDYKLVRLAPEEIKGLKNRRKAQLASGLMKGNKKKGAKKGGKGGGGSSSKPAPKKVEKKVVKTGKKVVKPASKKVAKPTPKSGKKVVKTGKRSRD